MNFQAILIAYLNEVLASLSECTYFTARRKIVEASGAYKFLRDKLLTYEDKQTIKTTFDSFLEKAEKVLCQIEASAEANNLEETVSDDASSEDDETTDVIDDTAINEVAEPPKPKQPKKKKKKH